MPRSSAQALIALAALLAPVANTHAELYFWTNGGSGSDFATATNWDVGAFFGAPDADDLAVYNNGDSGTIQITSDVAADSFRLSDGASVNHTAGTLTIATGAGPDSGLFVGEFGPNTSSYTLAGGTIQVDDPNANGLQLGRRGPAQFDFTSGTINHLDGDSVLGLDDSLTFNQSGGTFNALAIQVGWFQSPTVDVNLSGTAAWDLSGALLMSDGASQFANAISSNLNITGSSVSVSTNGLFLRDKANVNFVADASGVSPIVHNAGGFELQDLGGNGLPGLSVDLSAYGSTADEVILIDGFSRSEGAFDGLPEGTLVPNSGNRRITYRGGDGFDISLVPDADYVTPDPDPIPVDAVIARWSMDPNPDGPGPFAQGNPKSLDGRTALNEGVIKQNAASTAAEEHLWFFSLDNGHEFTTSTDVPPTSMFANGNDGGSSSYDASAVETFFSEGALFMPQNEYGNELAFDTSFSVELFFKTSEATNIQQLLLQGEDFARYGLTVNEDQGGVRFFVNNGSTIETIDIGGSTGDGEANYADGEWNYLLATFEDGAGANSTGQLTLSLADESGNVATVTRDLPAGFLDLPTGNDGNLFIGTEDFSLATDGDPRRFEGLIDEIQITRGLVSAGDQLGLLGEATLVPGDFNADGKVDNGDLNLLLGSWGSATAPPEWTNGFTSPVDNGELNALLSDWGFGAGVAVPEPGALLALAGCLAGLAVRRC